MLFRFTNSRTVPIDDLENRVLAGLRERMLTPDAFEAFAQEYRDEMTRRRAGRLKRRGEIQKEVSRLTFLIERLVDGICEGTDTPATRARLIELEAKKAELEQEHAATIAKAPVVDIHPDLPRIYRQKVEKLQEALNGDDATRSAASTILQSVIEKIVDRKSTRLNSSH